MDRDSPLRSRTQVEPPCSPGSPRMVTLSNMSSTLVETVSINYEDFNESFLTCGTCLCVYDGSEHTPKLLPCSHSVCLHCLARIAASQTRDTGSFRCPICRELITIPRGGVAALPPSFLVNQLLDLMSRQRREVVPKCSVHINQELLFCETCDTVFCALCVGGGGHGGGQSSNGEHTIIPFSIAIKRMSEILLYKANECISKLSQAEETVSAELQRLDVATEACLEEVSRAVAEVARTLEQRKAALLEAVTQACRDKRRVLEEQLALVAAEKEKVESECEGLQYQVEVRSISQRIASLGHKLESASTLREPRENAFLTCEFSHNDSQAQLEEALSRLGRVRTSTTFPSLCTASLEGAAVARLEAEVRLRTVDYHGCARTSGGDPVTAELVRDSPAGEPVPAQVTDCEDGTYTIRFRPTEPGSYQLRLSVLQRPIKDNPLTVSVTEHNNPVQTYGTTGSGKDELMQPVAVAVDPVANLAYVLDTGNSRIQVLNATDLTLLRHIQSAGLAGRSCTGIAVSRSGLVVVNWRTREVLELSTAGDTLRTLTHDKFQEPTDVAVEPGYGHILIADNGACCVFVLDSVGKLLFQVGRKGTGPGCFSHISTVCVAPSGQILVADTTIQVFSAKGDFMQELPVDSKGKGRYGGVVVDADGRVVATRSDKTRAYVQVLGLDGNLLNTIDSQSARLKRPAGVAVTPDRHALVIDLGNDCVKAYRYW